MLLAKKTRQCHLTTVRVMMPSPHATEHDISVRTRPAKPNAGINATYPQPLRSLNSASKVWRLRCLPNLDNLGFLSLIVFLFLVPLLFLMQNPIHCGVCENPKPKRARVVMDAWCQISLQKHNPTLPCPPISPKLSTSVCCPLSSSHSQCSGLTVAKEFESHDGWISLIPIFPA